MGSMPHSEAFAPLGTLSSSQPYAGQIFQPAHASEFPPNTGYSNSFDEEPPLLEGVELKQLITLSACSGSLC